MAISNWLFWGLCTGACLLSILTGCASVVHGTNQAVTIETLTVDGKLIEGAECSVANDKAETVALSGSSALVRRSGGTLNIECKQAGHLPASGQATSRINGGMVGNVVLGNRPRRSSMDTRGVEEVFAAMGVAAGAPGATAAGTAAAGAAASAVVPTRTPASGCSPTCAPRSKVRTSPKTSCIQLG